MDATANLRMQLQMAQAIIDGNTKIDASDLAELVLSLNEWLTAGGFLPQFWADIGVGK